MARVRAGRDWWPLSVHWALEGINPALPAAVARPSRTSEVAAVLRACHEAGVPVTPLAGRSGVCGGALPVFGGVALDLTGLSGLVAVDERSLLVDVRAGTFGEDLEGELRSRHAMTLGHFPQSIAISTVGGWVACRGAGQYSTRYGKIEDMVRGLEVVLADGRILRTGSNAPRAACGPDLTQLFVGSEGTLGVLTEVRLAAHPVPAGEARAVYGFGGESGFDRGLEACRNILRRGATPGVLRLYDRTESHRHFSMEETSVLLVIDEGDPLLVEAVMRVASSECAAHGAEELDPALAASWLDRRNDLPALEELAAGGIVADTAEISASWSSLPTIYHQAIASLERLEGTLTASAHQSHAYTDGACLYFTFAGRPPSGELAAKEAYYRAAFDAITGVVTANGGAISHHHGIGLNRAAYLPRCLGGAFGVLESLKQVLDPQGVLNPGKLGLASPFGRVLESGRKGW